MFLICARSLVLDLDPKSFSALSFFVDFFSLGVGAVFFVFNGLISQRGLSFFLEFVHVGLLYGLYSPDTCKLFNKMGVRI